MPTSSSHVTNGIEDFEKLHKFNKIEIIDIQDPNVPMMANAEVTECMPDSAEVNRSSGRNRVCKRCNFTTNDGKEFLHHQLNAHKAEATEIHLCNECDFSTASYTDLQKHRKIHMSQGRNQRLPSDDSESGRNVEDRVQKILQKSKSMEAESDGTEEDDGSSSRSGFSTKMYTCQDCGASTVSARKHLRHQVDEHQYDFIIHECDMCEYATKNKQNWTQHMKSHLGGGSSTSSRSNTPVTMVPFASPVPRVASDANMNVKEDDMASLPSEKDMYDENSNMPKKEVIAEKGSYSEIKERLSKGIVGENDRNKATENSAFKALQESLNLKPVDSSFRDDLKAATESGLPDSTAESSAFASDLEGDESSLVIDFQEEEKLKPAQSPAPAAPTVTTSTPVIMKPKTHVREAVDPAKYIKVHDTEGVKYACSKCGNLYKWRKSLNKHWKEKHDGEIPTPATSQIFTQLNIPRVNTKQSTTNVVPTIEIFARPSPVSAVKPSPTGLSLVRQRHDTIKIPSKPQQFNAGKSSRVSLGEPFNSYVDKQLSSSMTERKSGSTLDAHRLSFSPNIPPAAHTQSFRSRHQMRTPTPPMDNEPMDLSSSAKPASYNWQQKSRAPVSEVLDLSTKGSKKTGHTPISTPVDFSRRESLPASFGRRDPIPYNDRYSSPQGSDRIRNCPKCAFTTRSEEAYNLHMEVHLSKRSYKCAQCERIFITNEELNEHFSSMHYDVVPQLSNAKELSPPAAADAPAVGEVGENLQLYKYLTQNQEQQKQYICMVCGLGYKWKWDLGRHFKNMHPTINNPYSKRKPAEDDDVLIVDESSPANKRHRQSETGGKGEFQCKRCSFSCRNQTEMTKHNLIHSLEKTFYCNSCSFNTKSKEEFMLHMRHAHKVHIDGDTAVRFAQSGIRATESIQGDPGKMPSFDMEMDGENDSSYPLTPNQIGRPGSPSESNMLEDGTAIVFPQAPERGSPDLPQTPPKGGKTPKPPKNSSAEMLLPYKCSVCEYRARWPSEITQHMKNHSDEKPFHCPRCSYKSKWKWDVVKHLKRCGGGTVKDVIDTTKLKKPQALNFQNSPGKNGAILSNGPPNVTVMKSHNTNDISNVESLSVYQAGYMETGSNSEDDKRYNAVSEDNENSMEGIELSDSSSSVSLQDVVPSQSPVGKQKQSRKPLLPKTIVGLGQHRCNRCPFIGNSPAELKRHSRVHSDEKPFMCRTCGYSTKWKCDLKKHIRTYDHVAAPRPEDVKKPEKQSGTEGNQQETDDMEDEDVQIESPSLNIPKPHLYKCEKCQYVTYKKNFMDSHMKIHEKPTTAAKKPGGGKFKCKQCTFTTDDLAGFMQHKRGHAAGAPNTETKASVDLSPVVKKDDSNDKIENNGKHRRKQVKPGYRQGQALNENGSEDGNISSQESDVMGNPGELTCFFCPFTSDSEAVLERHVDNHGSGQRYGCEFCDWSVDTLKTLYFHAKNVHTKELSSMGKADFLEKVCPKANSSSESIAATDLEAISSLLNSDLDRDENRNGLERLREMEVNDNVTSPGSPNSTRSKRNRKIRTCEKCGYITDNMTNLQRHLDKHGQNAKYMCNYCDYSLDRLGLVQLHMKTIHTKEWFTSQKKDFPGDDKMTWKAKPNKILSPDLDDMVSESGESISSQGDDGISKKQDLTIPNKSQYVCPNCPFTTSNMSAITAHVKFHGSNKEFTCDSCDFSQDSAQLLEDHMKQVHQVVGSTGKSKKQIKNETKQNKTKMMQKLKLHLNALNARKNYQCTLCPYTSFVRSAVIKHKRMRHLKPNRYQCHLCPFNSTRVAPLQQHLAFHKSGFTEKKKRKARRESKTEPASVMSTRSSSVSSTSSKSGSTPKGKYVCEHCPYSCKVQAELKKHLKLHNGKLKYKCKHCTYSIDRLHFLQNHEKMHEDEIKDNKRRKSTSRERKPNVKATPDTHQCKQCAFKSQSAKDLDIHSQCHSDPNFCHLCPYSNKDPKSLDDHKEKHGSNGSYKCTSCDFAVDQISLLCQHVKVHNYRGFRLTTLEKKLAKRKKCPKCPYHTTSVVDFDAHKQKHLRKNNNNKINSSSDLKITRSQGNSSDGKKFYYKCTSCPYQTNNKGNFENHRAQHGVEQKLSCPYCDYGSPLTGQLYSHIKIHFPGTTLTSNILKVLSSKVNEISDPGNATAQEIVDLESQFLVVEGTVENEVESNPGSAIPKKTFNLKCHFLCSYCDEKFATKEKIINHEKQHL